MKQSSKDPFEVAFEEDEDENNEEEEENHTTTANNNNQSVKLELDEDYDEEDEEEEGKEKSIESPNRDNEFDEETPTATTINRRPGKEVVIADGGGGGDDELRRTGNVNEVASTGNQRNKKRKIVKSSNKEDEDEEEDENMDVDLVKFTPTGDPAKMAKMQEILSQLTDEQMSRYESFRRSGFQKANMKKLLASIIGTPKISVPMTIVVSGIAKMFVGELVETGKMVMTERGETGPIRPCHIREAYRRLKLEGKVPKKFVPRLFR
ncbi:hypothetical protein C5167_021775 [Papaver somniferum]|uniref:TAFII28-like protein domain-containing protein n=1 Tax=Papaver somniferum TaxID=3469 RepID=A0A4Y7JJ24_PAPSO|nr:hypothetical protein C5167_021775 [Papaver somniferum]